MPVLSREPMSFPEDLLGSLEGKKETSAKWSVLHTRPRAEKALARKLQSAEIPHFLPMFARRYRKQRRQITSWLPLFPSYVFVHANEDQLGIAISANQVANVLEVPDQAVLFKNLNSIIELIDKGKDVAPEERLEPGARAEIVAGPFKGREGTVLRRGSKLRLVVAVDFLHKGASVEVETDDVRWMP